MGRTSDAKDRLIDATMRLLFTEPYSKATVDMICAQAKVNKGSFYHFFDSKREIVMAALDREFEEDRKILDSLCSPVIPPLQRIWNMCAEARRWQRELWQLSGKILGAPLHSLGAELRTTEPKVCERIIGIIRQHRLYLESAIRDAAAAGQIRAEDPADKAHMLYVYYQGLLNEARIFNSLDVLDRMEDHTMVILGIAKVKPSSKRGKPQDNSE